MFSKNTNLLNFLQEPTSFHPCYISSSPITSQTTIKWNQWQSKLTGLICLSPLPSPAPAPLYQPHSAPSPLPSNHLCGRQMQPFYWWVHYAHWWKLLYISHIVTTASTLLITGLMMGIYCFWITYGSPQIQASHIYGMGIPGKGFGERIKAQVAATGFTSSSVHITPLTNPQFLLNMVSSSSPWTWPIYWQLTDAIGVACTSPLTICGSGLAVYNSSQIVLAVQSSP